MTQIRVLTDTPWISAVELYRACGFTELGSDGIDTHFVLDPRIGEPSNVVGRIP